MKMLRSARPALLRTGILVIAGLFSLRSAAQRLPPADTRDWFPLVTSRAHDDGVTHMGKWLDAPAGRHGFLTARGKDYSFEDGTPVKFWGVNLGDYHVFEAAAAPDDYVGFLRKYGINAVRLHKFTWDSNDGIHSTKLTDDHWKLLDRLSHRLRDAGIYYGWSHIYGHRVLPADSAGMLAYEEVRDLSYPYRHLNGSTSGLVNFAEDLQAINIELTMHMLQHRNPATGLRYAEDPALAFVEIQNEDDIYWGALSRSLEQAPTYRALLCRQFSDWLLDRYGSAAELRAAWGDEGIGPGESLEEKTMFPHPDHGWFSGYYVRAVEQSRPVPVHVRDRAAFLFERQMAYYRRATEAIRATGYRGVIVGSCWQAGSGITHFYNLYADQATGPIDRHNYWGGGAGHALRPGPYASASLLDEPGSGLLSAGLQQVADRPFQFSEWMALIPNEWTAEAAPLIATYGMGLQGWDASFAFALDYPYLSPGVAAGRGIYNAGGPTHLPLYPALAALVYRGDVSEGEVVARRTVRLGDLESGQLPFAERVEQDYDRKSIVGAVEPATIFAGRSVVSFADSGGVWRAPGLGEGSDTIVSTTGQLTYLRSERGRGSVRINTRGTQGVVGFTDGDPLAFDDLTVLTDNPFAVILASSLEPHRGLDSASTILVTTLARARNTGMRYAAAGDTLLAVGEPPALLEPVSVHLRLRRSGCRVRVLDHDGLPTGETIPLSDGKFWLDGRRYRTIYYAIDCGGE